VSVQLSLFPLPRPVRDLSDPECLDCGRDTVELGEFYMLHDQVWLEANPADEGMLCFRCVQTRLGRGLTADDFIDVPVNRWLELRFVA